MITKHSIALENCESLIASIRHCYMSNVIGCAGNLNGKGAGGHSCASKSDNGKDIGNHVERCPTLNCELKSRVVFADTLSFERRGEAEL
jgi:hypothetical protein